ncbi:TetR/AcrR family transcriptional regulator [Nocardia sp. NPDC052254]|uniref:TetR/AcrR family transcriptional regulator n=1 Tax=Nocardia sp. NPDC052254 TaxID=3155681 RepID=UPI00343FDE4E
MTGSSQDAPDPPRTDGGRREQVLAAALDTFVRYGYRKTSMEQIARAATISRPGLYLLFGSKQELFAAAVIGDLDRSLAAATLALADPDRPVHTRLLDAFDHWTGRYIGPMSNEVNTMAMEYADLLPGITAYPARFAALLEAAVADSTDLAGGRRSSAVTQTLISTSIGIKHQVTTREEFLRRMATAIGLFVDRVPEKHRESG